MTTPRIIDANANRAREALRVMEDVARFHLNDDELCARLKQLRHDLRAALDRLGDPSLLLAWRDTPGDVGTTVSTEAEARRENLREVAAAAAKRLTEALRAIEECAKVASPPLPGTQPGVAPAIEAIRYAAYDVEQRLFAALSGGRAAQWSVCLLLTESLCRRPWDEVAAAFIEAARGHLAAVQLREKDLPDRELLARARRLADLAHNTSATPPPAIIINDRPDIALLAGADGVHLGQSDLPIAAVRRLAGSSLLVGVSCSTMEHARAAVRQGADYCGLGPVFPSTTKPKPATQLAGVQLVRDYLADPQTRRVPHLAISGITPDNAPQLAAAGCRGVAVSGAICAKERPAEISRALCEVFAPTHWGDRRRGGGGSGELTADS